MPDPLLPLAFLGLDGLDALLSVETLAALVALTALEVVLGIDNVVFLAILTSKLPEEQQPGARKLGLSLAMLMRIGLLAGITWIMGLTATLFALPTPWGGPDHAWHEVSGRDLLLLAGGLFLLAKSTWEIHEQFEHASLGADTTRAGRAGYWGVILQVAALDAVFSLDSVITAVGMVQTDPEQRWVGLAVMATAIVIAIGVMMAFAGPVSGFVSRHPTFKMLALAFLILVGVMLVGEGFHLHLPRGYIYFAMAFSLGVELMNLALRKRRGGTGEPRGASSPAGS